MQQVEMRLADISPGEDYALSWPRFPERYEGAAEKFPGLPLLVVDDQGRVVCGHDYLLLLRQRGETGCRVLRVRLAAADALLLNYNLSNRLFGLNLYEKLLFVKKISPLLGDTEIRRRAELGFALNEPLRQALDLLLSDPFRPGLAAGRVGLKTALQLAGMAETDRLALLAVFQSCGFSESQQGLVVQMLEETAFREKKAIAALLAADGPVSLLAGEMPQKKFLAALHGLRYPAWELREQEWQAWQKKAAAGAGLSLAHAPYFANEEIQVILTVKNRLQAEKMLAGLKKIL
ncbi:MAG TPA: hypothetical protein VF451_00825 [Acidobacteriota bacterium]